MKISICILFSCFISNIQCFMKPFRNILLHSKTTDIREPLKTPEKSFPITGFYGLIGPNIDYKNISSLFDLFIGDGIIQGVFLENGTATFIKSVIKTEKLLFENSYGKMPNNQFVMMINTLLYHMKLLPNMLGVANTSLMNIKNKIYALFERDMPYEIGLDFQEKTITTLNRQSIPFLNTFSGHSKYIDGKIETIDYQILQNRVIWYQMDEQFNKLHEIIIPMCYIPMVHDFYSDNEYIIIIDSPLIVDWKHIFTNKIPIMFNDKLPTYINLIHKKTGFIQRYKCNKSFYMFHFGYVKITDDYISINSPFYDTMDYNTIYQTGKYRKIYIDRKIGVSHFLKMKNIENLNLDFPIPISNNRMILRNIKNNRINGFYIVEDLKIRKKIVFEDCFICGEPAVTYINNGEPILMCLSFNEKSNEKQFMTIHLDTYEIIEYAISTTLLIGFHSMFTTYDNFE